MISFHVISEKRIHGALHCTEWDIYAYTEDHRLRNSSLLEHLDSTPEDEEKESRKSNIEYYLLTIINNFIIYIY